MRNWNPSDCNSNSKVDTVFTVPMRNWNGLFVGSRGAGRLCFYSTYEELKHLCPRNWGLRPLLVFTVPMRNWNKLENWTSFGPHQVFTVPMRNWNWYKAIALETSWKSFYSTYEELKRIQMLNSMSNPVQFLQYLWGIETLTVGGRTLGIVWFLQYLWGIETSWNIIGR